MNKRKSVIITGILIIAVLIIALLGAVFIGNYLEDELQNQKFGVYQVQSREVSVNIFLRRITINDAVVEDSAANQRFIAPEIKATGIRILPLVFNDEAIINKLLIRQPEIIILQVEPDEEAPEVEAPPTEQDREIERIRVKQLEIADGAVLFQKQSSGDTDTLLSLQAGLEVRNLNIFSDRQQLSLDNHSAEKFEVRLTNGLYYIPGGLYKLQIGSLNFSSEQKTLNLKDLHFSTLHSKYNIAKQTGVETDWYDIILNQLSMKGINIHALTKDTAFIFQTVVLEGLEASIFRDKRPPFPDKPDSKLPMQMLESLPLPVHSDSILVKNGTVVYEEHADKSSEPGMVSFNRLYASIYNLGTIQDSIDGQTVMAVRTMVMNKTLLKAKFIFPNNEYSYQYQVSGNMEPVNLTAFNPMLIPAAFVKVEKGRIKRLNFDFTYDNNNSEGNLALEYENLNISLLDKEDGSEKTIKTFLTETFVLQENNLQQDNSYQKGTISFEREKKKSIFNYWWKSIFSGIKDILAF